MTLGELIRFLETIDSDTVAVIGFYNPHSYRGYYECLAFEPRADVTAGSMLECARGALQSTYEGYKGGMYTMQEYTDVYIAHYGQTGSELSYLLMLYTFSMVNGGTAKDIIDQI